MDWHCPIIKLFAYDFLHAIHNFDDDHRLRGST